LAIFNAIYPAAATGATTAVGVASARIAIPLNAAGNVPDFVMITVVTAVGSSGGGSYSAYQDSVTYWFGDVTVTATGGITITATDPPQIVAVPAGATHIASMRSALATQDTGLGISALAQPGQP
jgi:hypothetical protein